jgi:glycerol-3-phosphate cytidylyltransferase
MKKVITYGTYDLLHYGHIALLKRAKALGDYLIVGVTADMFDKSRGKLNVQQSLVERIEAVRNTGIADEIIVEEYEGQKIDDIQKYNVDIFTVGSDWVGKFDYLKEYCEVKYLPRTEGISCTQLRTEKNENIKLGIIGISNRAKRFWNESRYVSGVDIVGACDADDLKLKSFCEETGLKAYSDVEKMLEDVDAVYICLSIDKHYCLIMKSINYGCHVICETPMFLSKGQAQEVYKLADSKGVVVFEAAKTMWFPAFEHLLLLVNSGVIGSVKDVEVVCTQIPDREEGTNILNNKYEGSMYDWGTIVLLPIIKLLGLEYKACHLYNYTKDNFSYFTHGILEYNNGIGSFKAGRGMKSEGELIITGTNGYIYIPAPWWKTEYFEIRYEDLRDTKKYFYKFNGEGMRYEILEFAKMINNNQLENYKFSRNETLVITEIIEKFDKQNMKFI